MARDRPESVVVCGAGAAGLAAALAAARAGADVRLLEARSRLGGTVTHALIHTLGGLYGSAGEFLNGGLARELGEKLSKADDAVRRRRIGRAWVLNVAPELYQSVVERWIESEPRIRVLRSTSVSGIVREADRIVAVEARGKGDAFRLPTRAVVDATGTGEIARLIDPTLLQDDAGRGAGGLIFAMREVAAGTVAFPRVLGVVRALHGAAADGILPSDCGKAWVDAGVYEDEVYVKLLVPLSGGWRTRNGAITREITDTQAAVVAFLRRLPGFAGARLARTGDLGIRDGGRICGEYCLSADDVRGARKFEDAACRCCWPIEFWDADRGVSLEYLPDNEHYEIPLRALKVKGFRNVYAAGKCLSADRYAQASARVVGTCWSMGEAVGKAAALS